MHAQVIVLTIACVSALSKVFTTMQKKTHVFNPRGGNMREQSKGLQTYCGIGTHRLWQHIEQCDSVVSGAEDDDELNALRHERGWHVH